MSSSNDGQFRRGERFAAFVVANAAFVKSTIESYPPMQRVARYMYILRTATKERDEALVAAARATIAPLVVAELKDSRNTAVYRHFAQQCFEQGVPGVTLDAEWIAAKDRQGSVDLEKLQVALGQAQSSLSKDGIRSALMQIAELYFARGDVVNAHKHVIRARDSCSTAEHHAAYCILAAQLNCFHDAGTNLPGAAPYVQRWEQVVDSLSPEEFAQARIASGLVHLDRKAYRQAAQAFTSLRLPGREVKSTLDFEKVTAPFMRATDLALIATILAIATGDRADLQVFIANPDFKVLFETEPELRTAVNTFYDCQYSQSLALIDTLEKRLRLDLFFGPHAGSLLSQVRQRAIKQYVAPFVTVDLSRMAATFQTTVPELEAELGSMIVKGSIDVRIDKARGALQAMHSEPTEQVVLRAAALSRDFILDTEMALRTLSMQRNGVCVLPSASMLAVRDRDRGGTMMMMGGAGGMAMMAEGRF